MQHYKTSGYRLRLSPSLPALFIIAAFLMQVLVSCSKNNQDQPQPDSSSPDLQLAHGQLLGEVASQTIGPAGGTLISKDGIMKMEIPAGAVASPTTFSIQEVDNVLKNKARAYRLLPEGVEFKKEVQLTYHYGSINIEGSNPDFFFLAYQDEAGYFYRANKTRGDRQAQTLSVHTTHFSDWVFYAQYDLYFPNHKLANGELRLMEGEEALIELRAVYGNIQSGDYSRMSKPGLGSGAVLQKASWDYSPKTGVMNSEAESASVVYKAPARVNSIERVYINVTINGDLGTDNLGNKVQQMQIRQPVVISPEGYFILTENGAEMAAASFSGEFTQLVGSQITATFPNGYVLSCYTYGTTGGFSYGEHYIPGKAVLLLVQNDNNAMGVVRAKICGEDATPVYSPGAFTLKSIAQQKGEYFEGEFETTMYGYEYCENGRTKTISGKFRFKKTN